MVMPKPRNPVVRALTAAPKRNAGRHADKRKPEPIEAPDSFCDRCNALKASEDLMNGPINTEWDGCSICGDCHSECDV
jgi:hypothetical protein